ncbi:MAG: HAD-IA family hydrolase [Candidatus Micrarchaeota archaeon]
MSKHILFDIDDTLFPSTEFSALARKNAINAMISMGLEESYEALNRRLEGIIRRKGSNYERHFDDLCRGLEVKSPGRYIAAAIGAYHDTKTAIAPFPRVPRTLMTLRERGYHLHIATQGSSIKQWDKLIRLRIALYFEDVFVSDEMGEGKGPAFYKKILSSLRAKPPDCMMVGDREDYDIAPAKAIGIRTARIISGKHAAVPSRAELRFEDISGLLSVLKPLKSVQSNTRP